MDIVKHIKQHTENLHKGFSSALPEQRQILKVVALDFYFLLPKFEEVISKYIKIDLTKNQLISDIKNRNIEKHQKASEKSNAEVDQYSDEYEEPEQLEMFILVAFDNSVSDTKNIDSLAGLFIGILNTLDYYENFSDEPEYWNELLEKEVAFQNEILSILKMHGAFDTSIYQKRYSNVKFSEL